MFLGRIKLKSMLENLNINIFNTWLTTDKPVAGEIQHFSYILMRKVPAQYF